MSSNTSSQEVGTRVIEALGDHDVEYLFATYGTDHPPLQKGLAEADGPTPIIGPHEMTAASAAHGYAQVTGEPQAVLVHVDVGTANLGASVHNAARSRVPVFILAGRTPQTTRDEQPGGRSIFVHYYQDVFDQHSLVREYTKWDYELQTWGNVDRVIDRGMDRCRSDPAGPVYLTLPREQLRTEIPGDAVATGPTTGTTDVAATTVPDDRIAGLADAVAAAEFPILVTTYLGREEAAVETLVRFAETAGVGVIERAPSFDMNFPRDHPQHLGFLSEPYLADADVVLVAGCDVPWVPSQATPRSDATVVHVDVDPAKPQYPLWDFEADVRVAASPDAVLEDLTDALADRSGTDTEERIEAIRTAATERRRERDERLAGATTADAITPEFLSRTIADVLEPTDVVVDETVTNTVTVLDYLERTEPGTYYSYCSSGLGWSAGASLGIKLAKPDERVVSVVGDGSFVLGNPLSSMHMARMYDLPHLVVVYNNSRWQAVGDAIVQQYGESPFPYEQFTTFDPPLDFAGPLSGMGCHAERVDDPAALEPALEVALEAVDAGQPAVLDVTLP